MQKTMSKFLVSFFFLQSIFYNRQNQLLPPRHYVYYTWNNPFKLRQLSIFCNGRSTTIELNVISFQLFSLLIDKASSVCFFSLSLVVSKSTMESMYFMRYSMTVLKQSWSSQITNPSSKRF
jgi:hypothetical protein